MSGCKIYLLLQVDGVCGRWQSHSIHRARMYAEEVGILYPRPRMPSLTDILESRASI